MQAIAKLRAARISAQKARLVADQIRGKHVNEAIEILTFSQKKGICHYFEAVKFRYC